MLLGVILFVQLVLIGLIRELTAFGMDIRKLRPGAFIIYEFC